MRAFILLRALPMLNRGVVFVFDQFNESKLGSPGGGAMILAWDNGNCQYGSQILPHAWCGATFILPGQTHKDETWFEEIENPEGEGDRKFRYYVSLKKHTFVEVS